MRFKAFLSQFNWLQNGSYHTFLGISERDWEFDGEGQNEIAATVVHHEWRQRVVIVDWHAFSVENFLELW